MVLLTALLLLGAAATLGAQAEPQRWTLRRGITVGATVDVPLTRISSVAVDGQRSLYVGQPMDRTVLVFSPDGRLLRRIGRDGRGPGELQGVSSLGWLGDTLWVIDPRLARTMLFDRDGRHLATLRHETLVERGGWRSTPTAYLRNGAVLSVPGVSQAAFSAASPPRLPIRRLSRAGEVLDTLGWHAAAARALSLRAPGGATILSSYQPFSDVPLPVVSPDGSTILMVERTAAQAGVAGHFRITAYDAGGGTSWTRVYRYTPRALPRSVGDSIVRELTEEFRRSLGSAGQAERAIRESLLLPPFVPPVTRAVIGSDGTIWLRREDLGQQRHVQWLVLDGRGTMLATLALPRGSEVKAADRSGVWAEESDADDVPCLVRYDVSERR